VTQLTKLEAYLSSHSLKMTTQRKIILEVFSSQEHHISLEELSFLVQQKLKGIGQATIYRTMKLFTDAGIAHERRFDDGLTRYEVLHDGEHHDHLICIACNRIIEFEDQIIEERQDQIAEKHGILILSHKLELYGRCIDQEVCLAYKQSKTLN
jgi:Fur family transcriptional regulator, ferric uptake regulator